jgi:hypothetical protein
MQVPSAMVKLLGVDMAEAKRSIVKLGILWLRWRLQSDRRSAAALTPAD